ncbi:MAG: L,D-transpeptidase [Syntrophales bacterium]|jgi:hypothetical protein|nr:L,D-transpeptidase [Syntrophales bacterium]
MPQLSVRLTLAILLICVIIAYNPRLISLPGPLPEDSAMEDLGRIVYPSLKNIPWRPHFILPDESLERLFGNRWVWVARFNRLDRRHAYPGMTIKVPLNLEDIEHYTPLPEMYGKAKPFRKYILIDVTEQWIGAYEYGKQKFSMPAVTGKAKHETPPGIFRVDALDRHHRSSLYDTADGKSKYPMDYAIRFYVSPDDTGYWIHARDMPGRPASHGCVGLFDEEMQNRVYKVPAEPVLNDAKKLYEWVMDGEETRVEAGGVQFMMNGPVLEVSGSLPVRLDFSQRM